MRFPNELDEYRAARDALLKEEFELRRRREAVAKQRRGLPFGGEVPTDYAFDGAGCTVHSWSCSRTARTRFSSTTSCSCRERPASRWKALARRARRSSTRSTPKHRTSCSASISPSLRKRRSSSFRSTDAGGVGATVRLLTSANTTYNANYHGESDHAQNPIATVFVRRDGATHHFWSSELFFAPNNPGMHPRNVDFIWPVWSVFDCTPEGRGTDWFPQLAYR